MMTVNVRCTMKLLIYLIHAPDESPDESPWHESVIQYESYMIYHESP